MKIQHLLSLMALAIIAFSFKSIDAKPDLSGSWVINIDKSTFGEAPHYTASRSLTIKQRNKDIEFKEISEGNSGADTTVAVTLKLDGSPTVIKTNTNATKTITANWSGDRQTLNEFTTCTIPNGNQEYYHQTEAWSSSDAGKTLTVKKSVEVNDGSKYEVTAVYEKK